jgi:Flp pilus assembly pilin Flp
VRTQHPCRATKVQVGTRPPPGVTALPAAYSDAMLRRARLLADDSGQTAVEYAMVIALVAAALVLLLEAGVPGDLFTSFWAAVQDALS